LCILPRVDGYGANEPWLKMLLMNVGMPEEEETSLPRGNPLAVD